MTLLSRLDCFRLVAGIHFGQFRAISCDPLRSRAIPCDSKEAPMAVPDDTLKAIIRDYRGFELTDDELDLVRPEVDSYLAELARLDDLDLSDVMSSRLIRMAARDEEKARSRYSSGQSPGQTPGQSQGGS
jgi:hypothetical protein